MSTNATQPQSPAPQPQPKRRTHVSCLKGSIEFAIPIDPTDMDSLGSANKLLSAAVAVLTGGKAYGKAEASLGKVPGDLLP